MTTPEMILRCLSSPGVRTCIPLCLVLGFATFAAFGKLGYPPPIPAFGNHLEEGLSD